MWRFSSCSSWVVDYTSTYNYDTVYLFDFRLTNYWLENAQGNKISDRFTSIVEVEGPQAVVGGTASRNTITKVGHLGNEVIEKFYDVSC